MSIRVMTAVWDHAGGVSGGTLLVLLAMADYAHDDGGGVYPTQATLARKARMGERNLRTCLDRLEEAGYIERRGKRGQIIEWAVECDPAKIAARNPIAESSGTGVPTEPSTEPSEGEANASPNSLVNAAEKYRNPQTPGSAAAPWLAIELGRLMRLNDDGAKLPAGLRELMSDEYLPHYGQGHIWASLDARRELMLKVEVKPALIKWLDELRLLVDADKREAREVAQVLRWCQRDGFWKTNILSPSKFRKQYPQLVLKWREEGGGDASSRSSGTRPPDRGPATSAQLDAIAGRAA